MTFCIISHVDHIQINNQWLAYAPYVREMNLWLKYVDQLIIVAPNQKTEQTAIDLAYDHKDIIFYQVPTFDIKTFRSKIKTIGRLPFIFWQVFRAMQQADHIHLRCPGDIGLIGALIQVVFPKKKKTAKYAGNWDSKANQPWSYRLQKWVLANTFLTHNMQVLVYGEWPNQTKNIKPFFTATYYESEKDFGGKGAENGISTPLDVTTPSLDLTTFCQVERIRDPSTLVRSSGVETQVPSESKVPSSQTTLLKNRIKFLFVGTLSAGKRPLYAMQLVEKLKQKGLAVQLDLLGEGSERQRLASYIEEHHLQDNIYLKGNQDKAATKQAYQNSQLMILPSKSEGWPKAVAEAMFWGCVPVVTAVSCVPYMIDHGKRGLTLTLDIEQDAQNILNLINDQATYENMRHKAQKWSQQYTLDKFEAEIVKLLKES
jgi:glycosyltransferase involved in cell wall biosynthesis